VHLEFKRAQLLAKVRHAGRSLRALAGRCAVSGGDDRRSPLGLDHIGASPSVIIRDRIAV
jgi:hypothetical protein